MDGNQRWSKKNNKKISESYLFGLKNLELILNGCIEKKINYVSVFALSSENIKRNSAYLIFKIIKNKHKELFSQFSKKGINIKFIGEKDFVPEEILDIFENYSVNNKDPKVTLNIIFNYGLQFELINIYNNLLKQKKKTITFDDIKKNMYLANVPDPDILIRTGGYKRLSNFIPLNLTYTEFFFTDTLWPDFTIEEMGGIINDFKKINRNYGL